MDLILPIQPQDNHWQAHRAAFPLEELSVEDLLLRPLTDRDFKSLCDFLCGDPEMTWTQKVWGKENVEYLLGLRLRHYQEFGFGLYAIEKNGRLIGMGGAQVWDELNHDIELVVYLAKSVWGVGIASTVLRWCLKRCADQGIEKVFAATRADNARSRKMIVRLGFDQFDRGVHYGYPAIFWRINPKNYALSKPK